MREEEIQVELYTTTGQKMLSQQLVASPGAVLTLSLEEYQLPSGTYIFKANTPGGFSFAQFLVVQAGS
jgi:hypothetical protein